MKKLFVIAWIVAVSGLASIALAEGDAGAPAAPATVAVATEITLTGTISKTEMEKNGKTIVSYIIKDTTGVETKLPKGGKKSAVDLSAYEGKVVTLKCTGTETEGKKGKKIKITTVNSVEAAAVTP